VTIVAENVVNVDIRYFAVHIPKQDDFGSLGLVQYKDQDCQRETKLHFRFSFSYLCFVF